MGRLHLGVRHNDRRDGPHPEVKGGLGELLKKTEGKQASTNF